MPWLLCRKWETGMNCNCGCRFVVVVCYDYSRRRLGWQHFSYIGSGCYVLCLFTQSLTGRYVLWLFTQVVSVYSCSLSLVVLCYVYSRRLWVRSHWHSSMSSISWLLPRVRKAKTGTKHRAIALSLSRHTVPLSKTSINKRCYLWDQCIGSGFLRMGGQRRP